MSYYLLFSTTNPSKEVVETFIHESERHEDASNAWVLLRNRAQPITSRETPAPVDEFASEFAGWSLEQMGAFFLQHMASDALPAATKRWLNPDTFVVLDDRSARDKTCVVMYYEERMPEDLRERGEWVDERAEKFWLSWRVPMRTAYGVTALLEMTPHLMVELFEEDGPDEDGVFHYTEIEEEIDEYERGQAEGGAEAGEE
ncbi:hypothetical protein SLS56_001162 [Neofusicoccum ribis]|uniref:Uncharacterized protein n=1 Tax=Neofusicoccum ribis TaxID=45134 RepID=A0ABR3TB02_9PEZI